MNKTEQKKLGGAYGKWNLINKKKEEQNVNKLQDNHNTHQ